MVVTVVPAVCTSAMLPRYTVVVVLGLAGSPLVTCCSTRCPSPSYKKASVVLGLLGTFCQLVSCPSASQPSCAPVWVVLVQVPALAVGARQTRLPAPS